MPWSASQCVYADRITTEDEFDAFMSQISAALVLRESEDTWGRIDGALVRFQAATRGGAHKLPSYVPVVREFSHVIASSLLSERSRLSGTAADVISSMAPRLGDGFAPLLSIFVPPLLQLCARTNKVMLKRAEKSLHLICHHCRPAGIIPHLLSSLQDKAPSLRAVAVGCIAVLIDGADPARFSRRVTELELCIRHAAVDASPDVRGPCRTVYGHYAALWPERIESCVAADSLLESLTPTARRYLANVPAAPQPEPPRQLTRVARETPRRQPVHRAPTAPQPEARHPAKPIFDDKAFTAAVHESHAEDDRESPIAHIPPPPPGAAPSDGVAYRLAIAREQMKLKGRSMPRTRPASMMLGARSASRPARVVYSGAPPDARRPKTGSSFTTGHKPLPGGRAHGQVSMAAQRAARAASQGAPGTPVAASENAAPSTPVRADKSPMRLAPTPREQFTPRRRPFGVLDGNCGTPRESSPREKPQPSPSPTRRDVIAE